MQSQLLPWRNSSKGKPGAFVDAFNHYGGVHVLRESWRAALQTGTRWTSATWSLNPALQARVGKGKNLPGFLFKKKKKSGKTLKTTDVASSGFCPRGRVGVEVRSGWPVAPLPLGGLCAQVGAVPSRQRADLTRFRHAFSAWLPVLVLHFQFAAPLGLARANPLFASLAWYMWK